MTPVKPNRPAIIHLVSDATGGTLQGLARACLAQFELSEPPHERFWNLIRSQEQLDLVIESIRKAPGLVLYTLVDAKLEKELKNACRAAKIPCISVLDPILKGFSSYFGQEVAGRPGRQYKLDEAYFDRMDALDFALHFDDGQLLKGLEEADIVLVGASRTSKTPTCIYLAHRGVRAANVPFVPGVPFPHEVLEAKHPLIIGLAEQPERLVEVRKARLRSESGEIDPRMATSDYLNIDAVEKEMREARRLYADQSWPVIDVTRRSVEETSAEIMTLLTMHRPEWRFI